MSHKTLIYFINITKYIVFLFCLIIFIYILLLKDSSGIAFAVETLASEFKIATYPSNNFISNANLAPGDKVSADLTVENEGQIDFTYYVSAVKEFGDEDLFNAFDLIIKNSGGQPIYKGKLKDLNNTYLGVIGCQSNAVLNFEICMPTVCDNTYQGKNVSTTFVLGAQEHPASLPQGEVIWDPPLEKPDVHVRQGRIMPISFHLINNGTFDTQKRGIELIITGSDKYGKPVEYVFSTVNNTLAWKEHGLNKPHYCLLFDTEKYPVALDTYYKASVRFGDKILDYTLFKSGN